MPSLTALERQRQANLCETSLTYTSSSRPAMATHRDSVSKQANIRGKEGLGYSSVTVCLPNMYEARSSIPSMTHTERVNPELEA